MLVVEFPPWVSSSYLNRFDDFGAGRSILAMTSKNQSRLALPTYALAICVVFFQGARYDGGNTKITPASSRGVQSGRFVLVIE